MEQGGAAREDVGEGVQVVFRVDFPWDGEPFACTEEVGAALFEAVEDLLGRRQRSVRVGR